MCIIIAMVVTMNACVRQVPRAVMDSSSESRSINQAMVETLSALPPTGGVDANSLDERKTSGSASRSKPESSSEKLDMGLLPLAGRPIRGEYTAPVTLVEFTDYQCPFCVRYNRETAVKLQSRYGDKVNYVVLHFPLETIHPFASQAAQAAECAADQGKFWEYHDTLFKDQSALGLTSLYSHAETLRLDTGQFSECLESGRKRNLLQEHIRVGIDLGINGTPFFIINGIILSGARSERIFQRVIEQALSQTAP